MRSPLCALAILGLPACVWVTDADVDARFEELTDADGDGFQDEAYGGNDCDDSDPAVHPAATEVCNGVDDDCSGSADDGLLAPWYPDDDGDGYGDDGGMSLICAPPSGWVEEGDDCDDGDAAVHPGADEVCNGVDDDCDDETDEDDATDAPIWYLDDDGDGFGDVTRFTEACEQPSDHVEDATDCDDADAAIHPDADELCNGVDDDCDEEIDEADAVDASTWYEDGDGDGYGDADSTARACSESAGWVADDSDCDDGDASIHPGGLETLGDSDDGDCDGDVDGFSFVLHDTRAAQRVEGPRLARGGGEVYLAWAAEELDDGGTLYDAVAVSVFDDEDPTAGERDFWSEGASSDLAQLNRFDLVANDNLWVTGSSWLDIGSRVIRLDAVNSGSRVHGSYEHRSSWPVSFDQLQLGLSTVGNVTAVGCGLAGAGVQAVQINASGVVAGTASPAAWGEALDSSDDHDVCEYDHVNYYFYMGSSAALRLDYYEFQSDRIVNIQSSAYSWELTDWEFTSAHGWLGLGYADLDGGAGVYLDLEPLGGGSSPYVWGPTGNPVVDLDVVPAPSGYEYACAVTATGGASLLWSDLMAAVPVLEALDLRVPELGAFEDCAITVTADSVALIALRSGDDIATAMVQVP
jgi:hypothetical protein